MTIYKTAKIKKKDLLLIRPNDNTFLVTTYCARTHKNRLKEAGLKTEGNITYHNFMFGVGSKSKDILIDEDGDMGVYNKVDDWFRQTKSKEQTEILQEFIDGITLHNNEVQYLHLNSFVEGQGDSAETTNQMYLLDFIYKGKRIVFSKQHYNVSFFIENCVKADSIIEDLAVKLSQVIKKYYDEVPRKIEYQMSFVINANGLTLTTKTRESDLLFTDENYVNKYYNNNVEGFHKKLLSNLKEKGGRGLYLIHGIPGSGKTTYIEYLTYWLSLEGRNVVYLPADNIGFFSDPTFSGFALDYLKDAIIIIEDAEEVLVSKGVRNTATSSLLQLTDGFLSKFINCTVIATFNTKVDDIDSALKRKGRLQGTIEIGELEQEKIDALKKEFNLTSDGKTLADLFNTRDTDFEQSRTKIGF